MIEIQPSHRGLLHREMGIAPNKKISIGALMQQKFKDKRTGNVAGEKRATFALNARAWNK
jgi:hypothetical protein